MNTKVIVLIIATLGLTLNAFAAREHNLSCLVGPKDKQKSLFFTISDLDLSTKLGQITLANYVIPENDGERVQVCGPNGQCDTTFVIPKWEIFQQAKLVAKIQWAHDELSSKDFISAIELDMGKTGMIAVELKEPLDSSGSAPAELKATVMGFNFPDGVTGECTYFLTNGPKPGLTGSN